jgi:hypothetical protein
MSARVDAGVMRLGQPQHRVRLVVLDPLRRRRLGGAARADAGNEGVTFDGPR